MNFACPPKLRAALLGVMTTSLSACAVGPNYHRPEQPLATPLPATYAAVSESVSSTSDVGIAAPDVATNQAATNQAETNQTDAAAKKPASAAASQSAVPVQWWTLYGDTRLNALVEQGLRSNADVALALARIDEASALLDEVDAALLPEIDLDLGRTRSRSSTLGQPLPPGTPVLQTSNRVAFSTSFEIDVWGKLRRTSESARARFLASRYASDVVRITLASTIARNYFGLRALDTQLRVARDTLQVRSSSLQVAEARERGGLSSALDLQQAQSARADAALQLNDLARQRAVLAHALGVLVGNVGLVLEASDSDSLPIAPQIPAGLPSQLLDRRPDVRQAEQALIAANAEIGVAQAARLPGLSLTAAYGGISSAFEDLLKTGARFWNVGLAAAVPVLDAGRYAARTRQAEARQRQALAQYRQSIETAFREVADALTGTQSNLQRASEVAIRRDAAREALRLSQLRYESGYSPFLDVLDAQRTANDAELAVVSESLQTLNDSIDLMKALGGGWSDDYLKDLNRSAH